LPKEAYEINQGVWVSKLQYSYSACTTAESTGYHKGKLVPGVEIFPYMSVLKPILGDAMLNLGGTVASLGTDKERVAFPILTTKEKWPLLSATKVFMVNL
jgi:apolipoprotein N-acyltransferase